MKSLVMWLSALVSAESKQFELNWNVGTTILVGCSWIAVSAFLMEPHMTRSTVFKLVIALGIALVGIVLSTKPLMTFSASLVVVASRWVIASIFAKSIFALAIAAGLIAIAWLLIKMFPRATGVWN
jgi:hypothetical protein